MKKLHHLLGTAVLMAALWSQGKSWNFQDASQGTPLEKSKVTEQGFLSGFSDQMEKRGFQILNEQIPQNFLIAFDFTLTPPADRGILRQELTLIQTGATNLPSAQTPKTTGIRLGLEEYQKERYSIIMYLGLGKDLPSCQLKPVTIASQKRHHLEVEGHCPGEIIFRLDGQELDRFPLLDPIVEHSPQKWLIGGRWGKTCGFYGIIHQLEVKELPEMKTDVIPWGRQAFLPAEKTPLSFKILGKIENGTLLYKDAVNGEKQLLPDKEGICSFIPETRLMPGTVPFTLTLQDKDGKFLITKHYAYGVTQPRGDGFPIVMWLDAKSMFQALPEEEIIQTGFNCTATGASSHLPYDERYATEIQGKYRYLDRLMMQGHRWIDQVLTKHTGLHEYHKKYPRHDRNGKEINSLNVEAPEVRERMRQFAESAGKTLGSHPAMQGVLLNTEQRDHTSPNLDKAANERYLKETGRPIPKEVLGKTPIHFSRIACLKKNPIIPDDHPIYLYYKWFWKDGDGWNPLHTLMHQAYRQYVTIPDFFTSFDPAVRVPPIWGSGGEADNLNQWVYPYPEPFRTMGVVREQAAMASGGKPGQTYTGMVQLITKRFQVTNSKKIPDGPTPEWFLRDNASYTTVPPDLLVEATWGALTAQIQGMMYYGRGSLYPAYRQHTGLRFTDPTSEPAMRHLFTKVLAPLGPLVKRLPMMPAQVALYESDGAALFAQRCAWGWGSEWLSGQLLQCANIPYDVVYHEMAAQGALEKYRAIYLPLGEALTQEELKLLTAFQEKGGIIIADYRLVPQLMPDILVSPIEYKEQESALETYKKYCVSAKSLRQKLAPYVQLPFDATQEVILAGKTWKEDLYVMAINDKRDLGPLLGPWKRVREKALPNEGKLTVTGHYPYVYELTSSAVPKVTHKGKQTIIQTKFAGAGGKMYLLRKNPLQEGRWKLPPTMKRGDTITCHFTMQEGKEGPMLPITVSVTDGAGNLVFQSHECLVDGLWSKQLTLPVNAQTGKWKWSAKIRGLNKTISNQILVK